MEFISEKIIETVAAEIGDSADQFKQATVELSEQQPEVVGYLFSENFELFTNAEREYILFLVLVIFKSIEREVGMFDLLTAEQISEMEEKNWNLLHEVDAKKFRDRMDVFFKDYFQEDLLAFVEDSLSEEDEEELVTKVGREPMFVALKSIIDGWCA